MLSKIKKFGFRATLGALALGAGLAGAAVATAPNAEAQTYYGWHRGGYGYGWHGYYAPRVAYSWGAYPRYYYGYRPYYRPYYPGYYYPGYYYPPYGGLSVTIPIR